MFKFFKSIFHQLTIYFSFSLLFLPHILVSAFLNIGISFNLLLELLGLQFTGKNIFQKNMQKLIVRIFYQADMANFYTGDMEGGERERECIEIERKKEK